MRVDLIEEGGASHTVYSGGDATASGGWLEIPLALTSYKVLKAKITTVGPTGQTEAIESIGLDVPATESYAYNEFNQLESVTGVDGLLTEFGYDGNGNQTSRSVRTGWVTQRTSYAYDQDDRLRTVTVPTASPGEATVQWGVSATASSAYGTGTGIWSTYQATGAPNETNCLASGRSWTPSNYSSMAPEWLQVEYATAAKAVGVKVVENRDSGSVTKVELIDEAGAPHEVWAGTDATTCGGTLEVKFEETTYNVRAVKLTTGGRLREEIDAVGLVTPPPPGPTITDTYAYDANGLRVEKTDGAGTARYLLDGLSAVAQYGTDGARQAWYTQSLARIDEVLSVVNGVGKFWYQADALGSVYTLTTAAGNVRARGGYDVYGEPVAEYGDAVGQPFGFTGREHELDSGLVYARARYLNPSAGAWTQLDPFNLGAWIESGESRAFFTFGQRTGLNNKLGSSLLRYPNLLNYYSALVGNPVNQVDPSGESGVPFACVADGLVAASILIQARRYDSVSATLLAMLGGIARLAMQAAIPELIALVATFVMLIEISDTTTTVLIPGRPEQPMGEKIKPDCPTSLKLLANICRALPAARQEGGRRVCLPVQTRQLVRRHSCSLRFAP